MSFAATQGSVSLPYSGGPVDRASYRRSDDGWIAALLDDGGKARLIPVVPTPSTGICSSPGLAEP